MLWKEFYDQYSDWPNDMIRREISCLEDMGSGDEIVDVILEIGDSHIRELLIEKAMDKKARFTIDNFQDLLDEVSDSLYEQLGNYTGYDHNDPYFDEDNMDWDDFCCSYEEWRLEILHRRVHKLRAFGPSDEVCAVIVNLEDADLGALLYERAIHAGVRFTEEELADMGIDPEPAIMTMDEILERNFSQEAMDDFVAEAEALVTDHAREKRNGRRLMILGILLGLFSKGGRRYRRRK